MQEQLHPKDLKRKLASVHCNILQQKSTSLDQRIINQVQYYFSDANLKRDQYLKKQMQKNKKGWIDLKSLLKFNKIRILMKEFESQENQIKELNRILNKSQLLRVHLMQVRRAVPYQQDELNKHKNTVYIQNLINISKDKLINKLQQYTKVFSLKYKFGETWAFADVQQTQKILKLNNVWLDQFKYSLRIMSYEQWLQYKQQYKRIRSDLRKLEKMIRQGKKQQTDKKNEYESNDEIEGQND